MARLKTKTKEFTPKQLLFIDAYVQRPNATRAAIASGTPPDSASVVGSEYLANVKISAEIDRRMLKIAERLEVTPAKIIAELAKLAFSNMQDYTIEVDGELVHDFTGVDRAQMAAVSEITVEEYTEGRGDNARNVKRTKFKLASKQAALDSLVKILRMGNEKEDGRFGVTIDNRTINVSVLEPEQRENFRALLEAARASSGGSAPV